MIARVTLEISLRKEFDYAIPVELASQVDVGSRVQVPFGARKVMGCVTGLAEQSEHTKLKPILKVIGAQNAPVEPLILDLVASEILRTRFGSGRGDEGEQGQKQRHCSSPDNPAHAMRNHFESLRWCRS